MPSDDFLTIGGRRLSSRQFSVIQTGMNMNMSANQIYKAIQGTELSMRRQNLLDVVRELRGEEKKQNAYKHTPKKYAITDAQHETARFGMNTKYAYTVKITTSSGFGEGEATRWVRLKTDRKLTRGEIEELAEQELESGDGWERYQESIKAVSLFRASRRVS